MSPGVRRLFFALWPEAEAASALRQQARRLVPIGGRVPALGDLHLTLCFLGGLDVAVLPDLAACANRLKARPFRLELTGVEYWQRARLLVATCTDVPVAALELASALRTCAAGVGAVLESRPFRPHVTLIRGLPPPGPAEPLLRLPEACNLAPKKFYLAESQPLERETASASAAPRYRRLMEWPLLA